MKEQSSKSESGKDIVKKELDLEKHESAPKTKADEKWFIPLADYFEDADNYYLHIEMPGVDEKGIDMDIYQDSLIVTGRSQESPVPGEQVIYSEYDSGGYHRHFGLLYGVVRDEIKAKMKDGVLTVILPKKEELKPRSITVTAG